MLTKKIISSSVALALTASVAMLAGCPAPGGNVPSPSASASAEPTSTASPTSTATSASPTATATSASPTATATSASPTATATASPTQSATNNTTPSGQTGQTPDINTRATFNGKVLDPNGVPVDGAKVNARSIDEGVNWVGEEQTTVGGAYVFRNAPVGARLAITVTKDGWTTRNRAEVLKSNLEGNPLANVFDFSGIYAIQDEPEINMIKINGKQALSEGSVALGNAIPNSDTGTGLSGLEPNLEVEMTFSEPVKRADVENFFRIVSQNFAVKNNTNFTVDANLSGVTFTWSNDDRVVTFKTNKPVLQERTGNEARYKVEFAQAFKDKTDKEAIVGKYIRYSPAVDNDYLVFSVKNDVTDPALTSVQATDGGAANDVLTLTYSEPMEVINESSEEAALSNPGDPSDTNDQLWAQSTGFDANNNTVTHVGYSTNGTAAGFRASYEIGRLTPPIAAGSRIMSLGFAGAVNGTAVGPARLAAGLRNARLTQNKVTLEFAPEAFNRDDRVIVSVGDNITGRYFDNRVNPAIDLNLNTGHAGITFANITDPSGRSMGTGNSTTSANISVDDSQRVSTAS